MAWESINEFLNSCEPVKIEIKKFASCPDYFFQIYFSKSFLQRSSFSSGCHVEVYKDSTNFDNIKITLATEDKTIKLLPSKNTDENHLLHVQFSYKYKLFAYPTGRPISRSVCLNPNIQGSKKNIITFELPKVEL